ncbi:MAG: hypothetical protein KY468_13810, partial [Armatimonadetes bacterium]|nr:hypothetical protein [Armatimonadota bacterium]
MLLAVEGIVTSTYKISRDEREFYSAGSIGTYCAMDGSGKRIKCTRIRGRKLHAGELRGICRVFDGVRSIHLSLCFGKAIRQALNTRRT